jgi:3-oxoacyl-[acyl-carrier-protein] synthase I
MIADVIGIGARGPIGLSSNQVAMCVRARKFEPRSVRMRDKRGNEVGLALTGGLGERLFGFERLVGLGAPALSEALSHAEPPTEEQPLPVIVCTAEPGRPDDDPRIEAELVARLAERSGLPLDAERSLVVRHGSAGFAQAITLAKALLDAGVPRVAVGGIDSYYHPDVVAWLDAEYRLQALDAEDGFIPSEGAAFVLLGRVPASEARWGRVVDVAVGSEPTAGHDEEPNIGAGMTELLHEVTARGGELPWGITDLNGERMRTREWEMASLRAMPSGAAQSRWAWDTGDVGAASGPMFTVVAMTWDKLGCAPAKRAAVALHADGAHRGVVVIEGKS